MKIAIVTMVYNESKNLSLWIRHYKKQIPNGELIIIDHGSDEPVGNFTSGTSILRIPRSAFDDRKRAKFISDMQSTLLSEFDCVIYTDCDELIVSKEYEILEDALKNEPINFDVINTIGINVWQLILTESTLDMGIPIAEQRSVGVVEKSMFKPSITKSAIKWTPGFHASNLKPYFGNGYYLFHLKFIDQEWTLKRQSITSAIEWSKEAVDRGWDRNQKLKSEEVHKKFLNISNLAKAGLIHEFDFTLDVNNTLEHSILDSKGNWRNDGEIKPRIVSIPKNILKKLP